jgi:cytochrome c biogenesis factor
MAVSITAGIGWNLVYIELMNTYNFVTAVIVISVAMYLVLQNMFDLVKFRKAVFLSSRFAHIGIGIMAIGIITSNLHSDVEQGRIFSNRESTVNNVAITLKGFEKETPSKLTMWIKRGGATEIARTDYYFNKRTNSLYREPYIQYSFFGDTYIIPDNFESGLDKITFGFLRKGEEKEIGGIRIKFLSFETEHMTSKNPKIGAKLQINRSIVTPSFILKNGKRLPKEENIPGTNRKISLHNIDVSHKAVWVYVSPEPGTPVPPDSVIINISRKRFIWLVWLGTIALVAGGFIAWFRNRE